ncbi:hypothetical protein PhCBS80983_g01447 [Powellomyces hirtus]|uniref:Uncharacterized protein n=1 Tax=Powellomyces hirtus TaxID=109895 RepID=A0A507EAY7_9FUNG|nr:hypothetical protein PhCBS80983_g01447 [Powellomyces hirtus]
MRFTQPRARTSDFDPAIASRRPTVENSENLSSPADPGYLPANLIQPKPRPPSVHARNLPAAAGNADGTLTPAQLKELLKASSNKTRICQRCHKLQHQNVQSKRHYPDADKLLADVRINKDGMVVCVVDVVDFPASLVRNLSQLVGIEKPVLLVANKTDLLPERVQRAALITRLKRDATRFGIVNLHDVILTSAANGVGLFELCEQVAPFQAAGHNIYLVGCTNVGKSALIRGLRELAGMDVKAGPVTSIMPGTTVGMVEIPWDLSRLVEKNEDILDVAEPEDGASVEPASKQAEEKKIQPGSLYDTPGLFSNNQITHLLNHTELAIAIPSKQIRPVAHELRDAHTVFVGGLFRIDVESTEQPFNFTFYTGAQLPIHVCRTDRADGLYAKHRGMNTQFMLPPIGPERAAEFPALELWRAIPVEGAIDLCFGGLGWVYVTGQGTLHVSTPAGAPVLLQREPPLITTKVVPRPKEHGSSTSASLRKRGREWRDSPKRQR